MKRKVIFIVAIFLLVGMTGCGNSSNAVSDTSGSGVPAQQEKDETAVKNNPQQKQPESGPEDRKENGAMKISIKSAEYEIIYELNNSPSAKDLYAQLPLSTEVEPFSNNEMTFYPPQKLDTSSTPLSGGEAGSLSYYEPWGDVVMFYAPCDPNGSLYELGTIISGKDDIEKLNGPITVSVYEE